MTLLLLLPPPSDLGWAFEITNQTSGGTYENGGSSAAMLDAGDSYSAFGIDNATDISLLDFEQSTASNVEFTWFFVSSNTAFDIYAHAHSIVKTGDFTNLGYNSIGYQLIERSPASPRVGQSSQLASVGGNGVIIGDNPTGFSLGDISAGKTKVFDGGRRTARIPGSIVDQATGFGSVYQFKGFPGGQKYDFSMGSGTLTAEVTYTIFAP